MVTSRTDLLVLGLPSSPRTLVSLTLITPSLKSTFFHFNIDTPDEMNRHIRTVIVAPITTAGNDYPTRVACHFKNKKGRIVLDQIRTTDKTRLIKNLGATGSDTQLKVISVLQRLFAF